LKNILLVQKKMPESVLIGGHVNEYALVEVKGPGLFMLFHNLKINIVVWKKNL
jgi:hypothetical protein